MQTQPRFGIDAPGVVLTLGLVDIGLLLLTAISLWLDRPDLASLTFGPGCSTSIASLLMVLTSTVGMPIVVRRMIGQLDLRGDEQLLEVGRGRGLLLLEAARQLPRGRTTGLELWSTRDQSGNAAAATQRNAELAGVSDRVQIDTGDMRRMPYPDAGFVVIVYSLAIHSLPNTADREQAADLISGRLAHPAYRSHQGLAAASGVTLRVRIEPPPPNRQLRADAARRRTKLENGPSPALRRP